MKSYHPILMLLIFLFSSAYSQDSPYFEDQSDKSIGIQHTPFDLANFIMLIEGEEESLYSLMPGTEILFTKRKNENQYYIGTFGYARSSSSYDREDYDYKSSLQFIDIKLGLKFTKGTGQAGNSISYSYILAGKRFGSTKYEENYDDEDSYETDSDYEKYQNQLLSPWMLAGGFGAEYFINANLSLNINLHGDLSYISASYKDDEGDTRTRKMMMINTRPILGLNIYY